MTISNRVGPDGVATPQSSGVKVIIVGLGLAGLTAAIECHRKGHEVIALERSSAIRVLGDSIALGSNATKVIQKWDNGQVLHQLTSLSDNVAAIEILNSSGKLYATDLMNGYGAGEGMIINRGSLVTTIHDYAKALGIDLRFGMTVTDFWEDEVEAGVIVNREQRIAADCVIGADGVHSKAQEVVLGRKITLHRSGLAAFRASFSASAIVGDPEAAWILEEAGVRDRMRRFISRDGLGLTLATGKRGQSIIWQLWHEDNPRARESWVNTTDTCVEDALALLKDWPIYQRVAAVLRHTPKDQLADYQIIKRDPLPTWISPSGRLMVIGDAAHPNVPAAGQGGGQAVEDAATLAIALELAGKYGIKLSLQAVEKIRYQRNCIIQESGNAIYSQAREPDWAAIEKDPSSIMLPRPKWIFGYDVQHDVYNEFPVVVRAIQEGTSYMPRNIPSDGKYQMVHDYKEEGI